MSYDQPPSQPSTPAGWYPDQSGIQRYWDGTAWTEHTAAPAAAAGYGAASTVGAGIVAAPTSDETTMAALAHGLAIFAGFLGPLIILLVKGDQSTYVKYHAIEALNFTITITIAAFVSALLIIVLVGLLLLPIVIIGALILHIMAVLAASRGEWYRYPIALRLIPSPVG